MPLLDEKMCGTETVWKARRAAPVFSTPVVVKHTGAVLVAAVDGSLCALDGDSGASVWYVFHFEGDRGGSPAHQASRAKSPT
jgi:outer membrane protein assembly factor BamB